MVAVALASVVCSSGTTAAVETTGNQKQSAIIPSPSVMSHDLPIVVDCSLRRECGISPPMPDEQFALSKLERVEVRVGGVKERSGQAGVALEVGKVVS